MKRRMPQIHGYTMTRGKTVLNQARKSQCAQFAALQAKVEATIDQKLQKVQQDEPMSSASEGRISALEQQVHDLTTSVQTFQSQQTQQNQRMHAQIQAVDQKV